MERAFPYQALDDLQEFLHDHCDALVTQESADGLEVRGAHKVPVRAVDVAVGNVERLEDRLRQSKRLGSKWMLACVPEGDFWLLKGTKT